MQMLLEYLPLIAFFVSWSFHGIYVATAVLMAALVLLVAGQWIVTRKVSRMHAATAVGAVVFGGITLALHDPLFIMIKPTVIYLLFAVALVASAFIGAKTLVQRGLEGQLSLPAVVWRRLNWMCASFFLFCAGLNLVVAFNFSEAVWVKFKVFGMLGLTVAFMAALAMYVAPHLPKEEDRA